MPRVVLHGAQIRCSQGTAPSKLVVVPGAAARFVGDAALATVHDCASNRNVFPFGLCRSATQPDVARALAATGVLTPQPCTPAIAPGWAPGSARMTLDGVPVLTEDSRCLCGFGGVVTVDDPGPTLLEVDG